MIGTGFREVLSQAIAVEKVTSPWAYISSLLGY